MINSLIIDSDKSTVSQLERFVNTTNGLRLERTFAEPMEASAFLRKNHQGIDLVFLAVEMPKLNGLELLDSFNEFPPVILLSSHEKYAIQAFEHGVLHFLLKPLEYDKFLKATERAFKINEPGKKPADYIFVRENNLFTKVSYKDILFFEAFGDYVKVQRHNKAHLVSSTMKHIEDKMRYNPDFIRIHRSYYINLNYLESFESEVAIVANKTIPIGGKYRSDLVNKLTVI